MELLSPACFLGLPPDERLEQLYLAYGGTECFAGLERLAQLRLLADQIGIDACIFSELGLYRGWLALLNPEACAEPSLLSLQGAVYALLFADAGDDTILDPSCFYGLSSEQREQAIFVAAASAGGGPGSNWILMGGTWHDTGIWIDTETWND